MTTETTYDAGTVGAKMHLILTNNGLEPPDADSVLEAYLKGLNFTSRALSGEPDEMERRLQDDASVYETSTLAAILIAVRTAAFEWLTVNRPMHWAKAGFDDSEE